ncbi:MAG: FkbM family methyltransferase [Woeseia sp.]
MKFLRSNQECPSNGQGTIVDIGAHNGVTSIGMLCPGELEQAIAREPEPRNFSMLRRSVALNGLKDRVVSLSFAVSDRIDEFDFEISKNNFRRLSSRSDNWAMWSMACAQAINRCS